MVSPHFNSVRMGHVILWSMADFWWSASGHRLHKIDEPLQADNRSDRMTTAPTAIHSGSIQLQRRLRARDPSDPRIMGAAPTQFRRAVVNAHFQQTRPLVAEKLAHLWQKETYKSVRHSDIQSGTTPSKLAHSWQRNSPTCGREKPTNRFVTPTFSPGLLLANSPTRGRETRPLVAERNPHNGSVNPTFSLGLGSSRSSSGTACGDGF